MLNLQSRDNACVKQNMTDSVRNIELNSCNHCFSGKAISTRVIQKISSVCEYYRCSAAVKTVRMRAEFVDSVARHGRNLQTVEQCLRIALCVYIV
jgi:hypothetical protein